MIRALFERLATPSHVRSLGLKELLSLTGEVPNRVDIAAFFQRFEEGTAVQYFVTPDAPRTAFSHSPAE